MVQRDALTILLHDLEELDHDLGGRADQNLTLSTLLSVGNGLEAVGEHRHLRHLHSTRTKSGSSSIHSTMLGTNISSQTKGRRADL